MASANFLVTAKDKIANFDLKETTDKIGNWLEKHPVIYKIVVFANHFFRAFAMLALISFLPFSTVANCLLVGAGSLFYRLTIERFCVFKFALPSCAGGMALHLSAPAIESIVEGVAFESFAAFGASFLWMIPSILYTLYVVKLSSNDVNAVLEAAEKRKPSTEVADAPCCCAT